MISFFRPPFIIELLQLDNVSYQEESYDDEHRDKDYLCQDHVRHDERHE